MKMSSEDMVMVVLLQIGAKDLTVLLLNFTRKFIAAHYFTAFC
jgi:hypothetical protein